MNINMIISFFAGVLIGPLIAHYSKNSAESISIRDALEMEKAKENNEEICELPVGMNLFNNVRLSYFIITLLNGLIWFLLSLFLNLTINFLIMALASSILLTISIVDFQVYEIPIECNVALLLLGIINLLFDLDNWLLYLIGFFAISILFFIIFLATKGNGMGGGDIKLMATLGLLLGWKYIILTMILGCFLGAAIHSVAMLILKKSRTLAFGPYLSMAAVVVMCYGKPIIDWYIGMMSPRF